VVVSLTSTNRKALTAYFIYCGWLIDLSVLLMIVILALGTQYYVIGDTSHEAS
jgi:hypothetical protein